MPEKTEIDGLLIVPATAFHLPQVKDIWETCYQESIDNKELENIFIQQTEDYHRYNRLCLDKGIAKGFLTATVYENSAEIYMLGAKDKLRKHLYKRALIQEFAREMYQKKVIRLESIRKCVY